MNSSLRHRAMRQGLWLCTMTMLELTTRATHAAENTLEEVMVLGRAPRSETSNTSAMQRQRAPLSSVMNVVNALPGINITGGDSFGLDDWSSTLVMRGYQLGIGEQQVGITIDGLPNGESSYLSGSKANRFIDTANLQGVLVSQGAADVSSRSLEALGGTLDFRTALPLLEPRWRAQLSSGSNDAQRYYARYDSGAVLEDTTRAWISTSRNEVMDWISETARNTQRNSALRFVTDVDRWTINGYASRAYAYENNYERLSREQFEQNPFADGLHAVWTGIPWLDQQYRRGWVTLRRNQFAYLKADFEQSDSLSWQFAIYDHRQHGRGDWLPPFIADLVNDGNAGHSELVPGNTFVGGAMTGVILFTDPRGISLVPRATCISSITYPYGGASPAFDPACYPAGANAQQSYRHTHYRRERSGATADVTFTHQWSDSYTYTARGGLWYEDSTRRELRDWHRMTATSVGPAYDIDAYWRQYQLQRERKVLNYYVANTIDHRLFNVVVGLRQFDVDIDGRDLITTPAPMSLNSKSEVLLSAGGTWHLPIEGWDLFASYAENAKPLTEAVLATDSHLDTPDAEQALNRELGLRINGKRTRASLVLFRSVFANRLEFFGDALLAQIPDYAADLSGQYDNVGGMTTRGLELAVSTALDERWNLFMSYSRTRARYLGTGLGRVVDNALDITPGNVVVGTPENMLAFGVEWNVTNFTAGLSSKYVSDRFIDRDNTSSAGSYSIADAYCMIRMPQLFSSVQNLELALVMNNVANRIYQGGISGFGAWTGAPRSTVLSLTADF